MNGNKLLLDSNIAIYLSKKTLALVDIAQPGDTLFVSLVTYMEVLGYSFESPAEERFTTAFFDTLQCLPITQSIADRVIAYRKNGRIKIPDAIILATAREYGCTLITRNVSDFIGLVVDVHIVNPFEKSAKQ